MTELDAESAKKLVERIWKRHEELHVNVKTYRQHFYQDTAVDPPMLPGYEGFARQTNVLTDNWAPLRARMCENSFRAQVTANDEYATSKAKSDMVEAYLISVTSRLKTKTGLDVQGALVDGMALDGGGVLHVYLDDADYQSAGGDYKELEDIGEEKAEDYTEEEYDPEAFKGKTKKKKYRETDKAYMTRRNRARASKGTWNWQVYSLRDCAWVEDTSPFCQYKYFVRRWVQPCIDWFEEWDKWDATEKQGAADVGMNGSKDEWRPETSPDKEVVISQLWTKKWIYELADGLDGADSDKGFTKKPNRMGMIPFFVPPGRYSHDSSPSNAFKPILISALRFKPWYDRYKSNMAALAEANAIPRWQCVAVDGNSLPPLTDEEGHVKVFSQHAMESTRPPDGYRYEQLGGANAGRDFVALGEDMEREMERALPSTGKVELGASTQSWTARMAIQQENIEPSGHLKDLAGAIQQAMEMMVEVNASGVLGDVSFYPDSGTEKMKAGEVVTLTPDDFKGLVVNCEIGTETGTERTAKQQFYAELFAQGLATEEDYIRDGEGQPMPDQVKARRDVDRYFDKNVKERMLQAKAAEVLGSKYAMLPVSQPGQPPFVDGMGKAVMPQEVLQQNGVQGFGSNGINPSSGMPDLQPPPPPGGVNVNMGMGLPG